MNKIIKVLPLILAIFTFSSLNAQMTEGMVKYEITDVESSDPAMGGQLSMMKGSELIVYFTADNQRVDMDMMGGMVKMTTLHSTNDSNTVMLMKMMGKKIKMTMNPEKISKMQGDDSVDVEDAMKNAKIEHFKNDTKEILGYTCHRVVVSIANNQADTELTLYVTKDIAMIKSVAKGIENLDLGGTALQYSVKVQGVMTLTYKATKIEDKVSADVFDVDTSEYEEMDPSLFGGMLGGH